MFSKIVALCSAGFVVFFVTTSCLKLYHKFYGEFHESSGDELTYFTVGSFRLFAYIDVCYHSRSPIQDSSYTIWIGCSPENSTYIIRDPGLESVFIEEITILDNETSDTLIRSSLIERLLKDANMIVPNDIRFGYGEHIISNQVSEIVLMFDLKYIDQEGDLVSQNVTRVMRKEEGHINDLFALKW